MRAILDSYFTIKPILVIEKHVNELLLIRLKTETKKGLNFTIFTKMLILYNYSLLLRSIQVFMDLKNDIHRSL